MNSDIPVGFSDNKEEPNYFLDVVRDFWNDTGLDTDAIELRWILNWFDEKRKLKLSSENLK
jgi:hypothetical protein